MPLLEDPRPVETLLNRCFPVPSGASFYDDFPVWNPRHGAEGVSRHGIFRDGELASCALLRRTWLRIRPQPAAPDGLVRIGIVGGVATDEKHRGRGLAEALLREVVASADQEGIPALVLWGNPSRLYLDQGFRPLGKQLRVPLSELSLPEPQTIENTQNHPENESLRLGFGPGILDWLQRRATGLAVTAKDGDWLQAHRNTRWLSLVAPGSPAKETVFAYAALDRGIDLPDLVHEWGGEPARLLKLLALLRDQRPGLALLGHPSQFLELGIIEGSKGLPPGAIEEPMALFRLQAPELELPLSGSWLWGLDAA